MIDSSDHPQKVVRSFSQREVGRYHARRLRRRARARPGVGPPLPLGWEVLRRSIGPGVAVVFIARYTRTDRLPTAAGYCVTVTRISRGCIAGYHESPTVCVTRIILQRSPPEPDTLAVASRVFFSDVADCCRLLGGNHARCTSFSCNEIEAVAARRLLGQAWCILQHSAVCAV